MRDVSGGQDTPKGQRGREKDNEGQPNHSESTSEPDSGTPKPPFPTSLPRYFRSLYVVQVLEERYMAVGLFTHSDENMGRVWEGLG